jgi:seryl-tRNA synthetase
MSTAAETITQEPARAAFLSELVAHGHLLPSGSPGIYGRGQVFDHVMNRVDDLVTRAGMGDKPERPRFPAVMPRATIEKAGYLKSFPHLCGAVFSYRGRNEDWGAALSMTDAVLVPAACYPAYPAIALRGVLPDHGVALDLGPCNVFRHEPSDDPARMCAFHQRELVRIGQPDAVLAWREAWITRAAEILEKAGLKAALDLASDAFFGRGGKLMANSQREQRLKFEALVPIASSAPTAVASFNFHQDHFGSAFGLRFRDGGVASSACVGFGLERITLAMFRAHGMELESWPKGVKNGLSL